MSAQDVGLCLKAQSDKGLEVQCGSEYQCSRWPANRDYWLEHVLVVFSDGFLRAAKRWPIPLIPELLSITNRTDLRPSVNISDNVSKLTSY